MPAVEHPQPSQTTERKIQQIRRQHRLIPIVWSAITYVLPIITLCLVFRSNYVEITLLVIFVNVLVRYGKRAFVWINATVDKHEHAKVEKAKANETPIEQNLVKPSAFTLLHCRIDRRELMNKTYIDDHQHWAFGVLLFFNPFFERGNPPEFGLMRAIYNAFKAASRFLALSWTIGWATIAGLRIALAFYGRWPKQLKSYNDEAWMAHNTLWVIMVVWTVGWGLWVVWLWRRERFTLTHDNYALTIQRLPFANATDPSLPSRYLRGIKETRTLPGKIFGYSHLTLETEQQQEQIPEVRFVAHPERTKSILNKICLRNANSGSPPKPD